MSRAALPALIAALLVGCAAPPAQQAQTALVGLPEESLLACAGAPDLARDEGGARTLSYHAKARVPAAAYTPRRLEIDDDIVPPPVVAESAGERGPVALCNAHFALRDGRVAAVRYEGAGGSEAACNRIVRACLAPRTISLAK